MKQLILAILLPLSIGCRAPGYFDSQANHPPMRANSRHFAISGKIVDSKKHSLVDVKLLVEMTRAYQMAGIAEEGYRYAGVDREEIVVGPEFDVFGEDLVGITLTFSKVGYEPKSLRYSYIDSDPKDWVVVRAGLLVVLNTK